MAEHWDTWNDIVFPEPAPPKRRDPVLSVLKWTGMVMLLMCVAPFYAAAVFLRTFVRI